MRHHIVQKERKCCGNSEILHKKVRDTTRKLEKHELICVVLRTISCIISESPLQLISFLTLQVFGETWSFLTESQWTRELLCGCGALTRILRKCPPTTWPWPWELFGGWVQYTVGSNLAEIRHGWQKPANYQLYSIQYMLHLRTAWHSLTWSGSDFAQRADWWLPQFMFYLVRLKHF